MEGQLHGLVDDIAVRSHPERVVAGIDTIDDLHRAEDAAVDPTIAPETDSLSAAAANEAALDQLERHQLQEFIHGVHEDENPLIEALKPLVFAHGADATRSALHTLGANLGGLEDTIINQDASTRALEVSVAADFLRGLAAEGDEADAAAANANPFHDAMGRFTKGAGKQREGRTAPRKDAFGPLPAEGGHLTPDENLERGTRAAQWVISGKKGHVVRNAMRVKGLGQVAFAWGNSGKKRLEHKEGYGFYHIIDKHGMSAAKALPHTLAFGKIHPHPDGAHKKLVFDGTNLAVVSREPKSNHMAVTSFDRPDKKYLASLGIHHS